MKSLLVCSFMFSSVLGFSAGHDDFLAQRRAEIERKTYELHQLERGETQRKDKEVYELHLQEAALDLSLIKKEGILDAKEKHHVNRFLTFIATAKRRMARIKFEDLSKVSEKTFAGQQKLKRVEVKTRSMQKIIEEMKTKVNQQITFLINDMCKKSKNKPVNQGKIDRIVNAVSFFR